MTFHTRENSNPCDSTVFLAGNIASHDEGNGGRMQKDIISLPMQGYGIYSYKLT